MVVKMSRSSRLRFCIIMIVTQHVILPFKVLQCLLTNACSPFELTLQFCRLTGVRLWLSHTSEASLSSSPKTMFLCNHRSWADFVIDSVLTSGSTYLARYLVALFLPWTFVYSQLTGNIMFFRRRRGIDRTELAEWMGKKWRARNYSGLLVYPEGSRNQSLRSLPLKHGVLDVARHLGMQVQCVVTTNKELVMDETRMLSAPGVDCVVSCSELVDPAKFTSREAFFAAVEKAWDRTWLDAYGAKPREGSVRLHLDEVSRQRPLLPGGLAPYYGPPPNWMLAWALRALLLGSVWLTFR